jgi:hypothetical protein
MNRTRIKTIGLLLLGTAIIGWTMPAQAGFEFSAAKAPAKEEAVAPEDALDAPMPIVPTNAVSAEPLDDMAAPENDHVLKAPGAVAQEAQSEPVYIRRQHSNIVIKADKGQPIDTEALLKATENGDMVELEGQPRTNLAASPASDGALVIDPYPLDSDKGASHSNMGKAATEQALMEQGGNLRARQNDLAL